MTKILRMLKRIPRAFGQRDFFLLPRPARPRKKLQRLGSPYGGWVCQPEMLGPGSVVYSFGVGTDISFDLALLALTGCTLHAFDPMPAAADWLKSQETPARLHFHHFGVADFDGYQIFREPDIPGYFSPSAVLAYPGAGNRWPVFRLETILQTLRHSRVDLLKLDIEGSEYTVIEDLCSSGIFPGQLLVEFHHRMVGVGIGKTKATLHRLKRAGYLLVSVSPRGEEFTFIRAAGGGSE